jgi:hypothetical protein
MNLHSIRLFYLVTNRLPLSLFCKLGSYKKYPSVYAQPKISVHLYSVGRYLQSCFSKHLSLSQCNAILCIV